MATKNNAPKVESMFVKRLANGNLKVYFGSEANIRKGGSRIASLILTPAQEKLFLAAIKESDNTGTNLTGAILNAAA